jgi:hypothetical protein
MKELKEGEIVKAGMKFYKVSIIDKFPGSGENKYETCTLKRLDAKELMELLNDYTLSREEVNNG